VSESPGTGSNVASLIPEFYYDLIGRVVPGVLVGFLYGWGGDIQFTNFGTISVGIVLAYFLGLTLDVFSDRLFYRAYRMLSPLIKYVSFLRVEDDGSLWNWTRALPTVEQIPLKKMFAEKVLFRIAAFVALVSVFVPPPIFKNCPYRIWIALIFAGLFFFCLHGMYRWMGFIKADRDKRKLKV
jgi:hypothetical protein